MTICYGEEVAVFETTEMRYGYPCVLICLVWIWWWHSCFSCKGELGYAVCIHLLRVSSVVRVFLLDLILKLLLLLSCRLFWLSLAWRFRSWLRKVLLCLWMSVISCHVMALGKWHILAWYRMWLLNNRSLVSLPLVISILNFDLWQLILIQWALLVTFQETVQIWFWSFVTTLRIQRGSIIILRKELARSIRWLIISIIIRSKENAWLCWWLILLSFLLCHGETWVILQIVWICNGCVIVIRLVWTIGMLTLTSLVDVLKDVSLDLHMVILIVSLCSIVLYLID